MTLLDDFSVGDRIQVLEVEPERNPLYPYDPYQGKQGRVVEIDALNKLLWVELDDGRQAWFEAWEVRKCDGRGLSR